MHRAYVLLTLAGHHIAGSSGRKEEREKKGVREGGRSLSLWLGGGWGVGGDGLGDCHCSVLSPFLVI